MDSTLDASKAVEIAKANVLGIANERDATKRLNNINNLYHPDIVMYDHTGPVTGHQRISDVCGKLLETYPDWSVELLSPVRFNYNIINLEWSFGQVKGGDTILLDASGKIEKIWVYVPGLNEAKLEG